ncbi:hypothetical protein SAMN05192550_0232 [Flavobacterium glycines]|nr:hypothetical protein [Flavobacterium glycines]SDI57044.1 hypothetical protein SAMN05192550_0232 [Flavobacterium glycines]
MKKLIAQFLLFSSTIFCYGQNAAIADSIYPPSDLTISYHTEWAKEKLNLHYLKF